MYSEVEQREFSGASGQLQPNPDGLRSLSALTGRSPAWKRPAMCTKACIIAAYLLTTSTAWSSVSATSLVAATMDGRLASIRLRIEIRRLGDSEKTHPMPKSMSRNITFPLSAARLLRAVERKLPL